MEIIKWSYFNLTNYHYDRNIFCPETPRWLFKKKDRQSAEKSLKCIRKIDDVTAELNAIADAIREENNELSIKELLLIEIVSLTTDDTF
jgi:hypothetical protein